MLTLDLIAEERIRDAIRAGVFNDLPGAGRPLALDDETLIPEELRIAYRILKNAGCLPPEIETRKESATLRKLVAAATDDAARRRALAKLAHVDLLAHFAAVVGGDEIERGKPAPDIYLEAARRLAVAPAACVVLTGTLDVGVDTAVGGSPGRSAIGCSP